MADNTKAAQGSEEPEDELYKALDERSEALSKHLGAGADRSEDDEDLTKAKAKKAVEDEDEAEPELPEEEEEEEEEESEPAMKSLDEEAEELLEKALGMSSEEVLEVTPLIEEYTQRTIRLDRMLQKHMKRESSRFKALAEVVITQGKLLKAIREELKAIGDMPLPRKSKLSVMKKSFAGETGESPNELDGLSKAQVLQKLSKGVQSGVIDARAVTAFEISNHLPPDIWTAVKDL